jgi:hypothetical protein
LSVDAIIGDEVAALDAERIRPFDVPAHTGADVET